MSRWRDTKSSSTRSNGRDDRPRNRNYSPDRTHRANESTRPRQTSNDDTSMNARHMRAGSPQRRRNLPDSKIQFDDERNVDRYRDVRSRTPEYRSATTRSQRDTEFRHDTRGSWSSSNRDTDRGMTNATYNDASAIRRDREYNSHYRRSSPGSTRLARERPPEPHASHADERSYSYSGRSDNKQGYRGDRRAQSRERSNAHYIREDRTNSYREERFFDQRRVDTSNSRRFRSPSGDHPPSVERTGRDMPTSASRRGRRNSSVRSSGRRSFRGNSPDARDINRSPDARPTRGEVTEWEPTAKYSRRSPSPRHSSFYNKRDDTGRRRDNAPRRSSIISMASELDSRTPGRTYHEYTRDEEYGRQSSYRPRRSPSTHVRRARDDDTPHGLNTSRRNGDRLDLHRRSKTPDPGNNRSSDDRRSRHAATMRRRDYTRSPTPPRRNLPPRSDRGLPRDAASQKQPITQPSLNQDTSLARTERRSRFDKSSKDAHMEEHKKHEDESKNNDQYSDDLPVSLRQASPSGPQQSPTTQYKVNDRDLPRSASRSVQDRASLSPELADLLHSPTEVSDLRVRDDDRSSGRYVELNRSQGKRSITIEAEAASHKRSKTEHNQQQFCTPESIPTPHASRSKQVLNGKQKLENTRSSTNQSNMDQLSDAKASDEPSVYERIGQVGEGTYGKVYKARHRKTNEFVALKRIRLEQERDGFPITSMREIKLLQSLRHPGVVRLLEMMVERGNVHMVFEYMDHDLTGILSNTNIKFEPPHIKDLAYQLFDGLAYLHHRGVLHRDIKGSNILLNSAGQLKLADFGLARFYGKTRGVGADYTNRVITLWFRPPELLLGATAYDAAVDIWSAGCIFVELFTQATIFPGRDEIHQIETIYRIIGSPIPSTWPTVQELPWYELIKFQPYEPDFNRLYAKKLSPGALDLSVSILQLDPSRRPLAHDILEHPYFTVEEPKAERRALFDIAESHEWDSKQRRRDERARKLREEKEGIAVQDSSAIGDMTVGGIGATTTTMTTGLSETRQT